jgi:hypothetical protein
MAKLKRFPRRAEDHVSYVFRCPGCADEHMITTLRPPGSTGPVWGFNGDLDRPTFTPSYLLTYQDLSGDGQNEVCHSFIRDGMIQFLGDCTHALAGQTVPLPDADE